MSGDVHVRFCESRGVRFPPATHLVVLCTTEQQAQAAYDWLVATLNGLKLECHPDKTRVVHLADGSQGSTFWGFTFGDCLRGVGADIGRPGTGRAGRR